MFMTSTYCIISYFRYNSSILRRIFCFIFLHTIIAKTEIIKSIRSKNSLKIVISFYWCGYETCINRPIIYRAEVQRTWHVIRNIFFNDIIRMIYYARLFYVPLQWKRTINSMHCVHWPPALVASESFGQTSFSIFISYKYTQFFNRARRALKCLLFPRVNNRFSWVTAKPASPKQIDRPRQGVPCQLAMQNHELGSGEDRPH